MDALKFKVKKQEVLPTGDYVVECQDVAIADGKYGPQVRWRLYVEHGDGVELSAWTSTSQSLRSKTVAWYQAFCGEVEAGETVDLRDCVGKVALATILRKTGDEGEFNKVDDIRPLPKAKRIAQSAQSTVTKKVDAAEQIKERMASGVAGDARAELERRIDKLGLRELFATWWAEHKGDYRSLSSFALAVTQLNDDDLVGLLTGDPFVEVLEQEAEEEED